MKVAFIGTGNMGGPMAANIAKSGHEVFVHDSDGAKAARDLLGADEDNSKAILAWWGKTERS
jgi:3-hydroxyisobutyrate dehydrogenase